jgi:hypothetical protein
MQPKIAAGLPVVREGIQTVTQALAGGGQDFRLNVFPDPDNYHPGW